LVEFPTLLEFSLAQKYFDVEKRWIDLNSKAWGYSLCHMPGFDFEKMTYHVWTSISCFIILPKNHDSIFLKVLWKYKRIHVSYWNYQLFFLQDQVFCVNLESSY
jgi:hypothetical protein